MENNFNFELRKDIIENNNENFLQKDISLDNYNNEEISNNDENIFKEYEEKLKSNLDKILLLDNKNDIEDINNSKLDENDTPNFNQINDLNDKEINLELDKEKEINLELENKKEDNLLNCNISDDNDALSNKILQSKFNINTNNKNKHKKPPVDPKNFKNSNFLKTNKSRSINKKNNSINSIKRKKSINKKKVHSNSLILNSDEKIKDLMQQINKLKKENYVLQEDNRKLKLRQNRYNKIISNDKSNKEIIKKLTSIIDRQKEKIWKFKEEILKYQKQKAKTKKQSNDRTNEQLKKQNKELETDLNSLKLKYNKILTFLNKKNKREISKTKN